MSTNGTETPSTSTAVENGPSSPQAVDSSSSSFPLAAQISLKSFELPDFPPQASRLRQLTLTADIKLDEYQGMVQQITTTTATATTTTQPPLLPLPNLPQSITHLTLELFGLGFPGHTQFLSRIATALPNIMSLTLFSCLIDGLDEASRTDAEAFFRLLPRLQELHVIDSFARPGFFKTIGGIFEERSNKHGHDPDQGPVDSGLKMVEVSYTFRGHEDSDFLARIQGEELPNLMVTGLVGASFDFVPEVVDELAEAEAEGEAGREGRGKGKGEEVDKSDNTKAEAEAREPGKHKQKVAQGILPFASDGRAPTALKKRLDNLSLSTTGALQTIKVLNLGMWCLRPVEVGEVVVHACAGAVGGEGGPVGQSGLADLTVSVLLEDDWVEELIKGFGHKGVRAAPGLEGIEIIGVPKTADGVAVKGEEDAKTITAAANTTKEGDEDQKHGLSLLKLSDVQRLSEGCPKLGKLGLSILKVKSAPHLLFFKDQDRGIWTQQ